MNDDAIMKDLDELGRCIAKKCLELDLTIDQCIVGLSRVILGVVHSSDYETSEVMLGDGAVKVFTEPEAETGTFKH